MEFAGEVIVQEATLFQNMGDVLSFLFYSPFFSVLKFAAAIYVAVIVVDMVLLLILNGAQENYRKEKRGTNIPTTAESVRKWKRIKAHLKKDEQNHFKAAILEADQMVEKILIDVKYKQPTMVEKIDKLESQHIDSAKILREAHAMSVRVIQDPTLRLSRQQTEDTLMLYEQFMDDMEIFG